MRRRLLALVMAVVMTAAMLTGCGSSGMSDEMFAQLQSNYTDLLAAYNAAIDVYNDDATEKDEGIEEALGQASTVIDKMAALKQSDMTDEEAQEYSGDIVELTQNINYYTEQQRQLNTLKTSVSDETFADLQEMHSEVVGLYNQVSDLYYDTAAVPQDDDIENSLDDAREALNAIAEVTRDDINEEEAATLMVQLTEIAQGLNTITQAINASID